MQRLLLDVVKPKPGRGFLALVFGVCLIFGGVEVGISQSVKLVLG